MVDTYNMILIGAIVGIFVAIAVIIIMCFCAENKKALKDYFKASGAYTRQ